MGNKKDRTVLFVLLIFGVVITGVLIFGGMSGWFNSNTTINNQYETNKATNNPSTPASTSTPSNTATNTTDSWIDIQWCKFFGCNEPELIANVPQVAVPITPTSNYVPIIFPCKDSDGGFNLYVKGKASITDKTGTTEAYDSCQFDITGQRRLLEAYCVDNKIVQSNGVCPSGYGCWDGICQTFKRCGSITPVQQTDCQIMGGDNCKYNSGLSLYGGRTTPSCVLA